MEVKQLLKEYRLLKYIDENKRAKNVAILLVSDLKELGINEDEQYSLLANLHDKAILQRLNETEIIIYGKAGGEDLGEDLVKLQLTLAALSYPKPCPKHIVKIIPERFYPHLEDTKRKSELAKIEEKKPIEERIIEQLKTLLPKKKKNTIADRIPTGTQWKSIIIKFLNNKEIWIKSPKYEGRATYKDLGLVGKGKDPEPSIVWGFFRIMAKYNGELDWSNPEAEFKNKKRKQLLTEALQNYFGIESDPFYPYRPSPDKPTKYYKTWFTLIPPPQSGEKDDFVKFEDLKDEDDKDDDIKRYYEEQTPSL